MDYNLNLRHLLHWSNFLQQLVGTDAGNTFTPVCTHALFVASVLSMRINVPIFPFNDIRLCTNNELLSRQVTGQCMTLKCEIRMAKCKNFHQLVK